MLLPAANRHISNGDDLTSPTTPARQGLFHFNRLHYDSETPAHRIDVGGGDQQSKWVLTLLMLCMATQLVLIDRLTEFANNSFDNMNNGRSIAEALKALGLSRYILHLASMFFYPEHRGTVECRSFQG
jgi:hypothetical protein